MLSQTGRGLENKISGPVDGVPLQPHHWWIDMPGVLLHDLRYEVPTSVEPQLNYPTKNRQFDSLVETPVHFFPLIPMIVLS